MKRFLLTILAYLVPTFALGFVWHLILFEDAYKALQIYRDDVIIPFGFASMLIQAILFGWVYLTSFANRSRGFAARAGAYGLFGAVLSWSFTTLAVAAKNRMGLVSGYMEIETAFTLVQWLMVAPLTVWSGGSVDTDAPLRV